MQFASDASSSMLSGVITESQDFRRALIEIVSRATPSHGLGISEYLDALSRMLRACFRCYSRSSCPSSVALLDVTALLSSVNLLILNSHSD